MATISKYPTAKGDRYRVRYRKPDGRQTDKRGFLRKKDAEAFAATVEVSKLQGDYVAPSLGRETIGNLGPRWLELKKGSVKPAHYDKLESAWRLHVKPTWEHTAIAKVAKSEVQVWINKTGNSATVKRRAAGVLAGILDLAVDDGLIMRHPARDVTLPKKPKGTHEYLTVDQLNFFLTHVHEYHRPFARFLAVTGLRYGEAAALQGKHINRARGRISVEQTMFYQKVEEGRGEYSTGEVKTYEKRSVPVAKEILNTLPLVFPEAYVFPTQEGRMRPYVGSTRGWWFTAVKNAQEADEHFPRITPHDLRHTAASLAVSAGANVKALQRMLGHASAAMTLDVYADLFDTDLDDVATKIIRGIAV